MTKPDSERAFRLATTMAEWDCSPDLIVETLVGYACPCEDDAIRIVAQARLCVIYDRMAAN